MIERTYNYVTCKRCGFTAPIDVKHDCVPIELSTAVAAIKRVRELHREIRAAGFIICNECTSHNSDADGESHRLVLYPCSTIKSLGR